jgi:hypothetical protein
MTKNEAYQSAREASEKIKQDAYAAANFALSLFEINHGDDVAPEPADHRSRGAADSERSEAG